LSNFIAVNFFTILSQICFIYTLLTLLYNGYWVFPGGKVQPGRDADPSTPSSAEVKNKVELYLYSP